MKKLVLNLILALTCLGMGVVFAEEQTNVSSKKDECLLISKNCQNQVLSLQEKMKRLQTEIQKGTRVYTPQELQNLQEKLKDTENTIDDLLRKQ